MVESILFDNKWVRYTYDFGDEWRHKIVYEKTDEAYSQRYASLLKFKGENFLEDFGGIWSGEAWEAEYRSAFEPEIVEKQLKELVCPVRSYPVELPEKETGLERMFDKLMKQLSEKMAKEGDKYAALTSVSQMTEKIDAWEKFAEDWEEGNEDTWEITVPGCGNAMRQGKTNRELLQALSYKEARDYCKYLQIPVLDTWTKEQMTDALADTLAEHPEYFLYVLFKDEYAELVRLMKLPRGEIKENLENPDIWIKGAVLGLADISVKHGKKGSRAEISFASDAEALLSALTAKERNAVYRKLKSFSDNFGNLIVFYGFIELDALYKIYCQSYGAAIERTEFNRYIYWHERFNNQIQTAVTDEGISYAAVPQVDMETLGRKIRKYAGDLEYAMYPVKDLKKMADNIGARSEWVDILFSCLHFQAGLPQSVTGSVLEDIFCSVMNGDTMPEIMEQLYEALDGFGIKPELALRCDMWVCISGLMLEVELPMLKGRSRTGYGEEKNVSPWTIGMFENAGEKQKADSRTKQIWEFPVEAQEMMHSACSFADSNAMKDLMQLRKREKIQSEEFLYLLASAYITGCRLEEALDILRELEKGSKQAKKAADRLRARLENGADVVDEPWEPLDESWDLMEPMEPLQKPYVRKERKIGRNEPCPCGSGKKYKHCCGR